MVGNHSFPCGQFLTSSCTCNLPLNCFILFLNKDREERGGELSLVFFISICERGKPKKKKEGESVYCATDWHLTKRAFCLILFFLQKRKCLLGAKRNKTVVAIKFKLAFSLRGFAFLEEFPLSANLKHNASFGRQTDKWQFLCLIKARKKGEREGGRERDPTTDRHKD